MKSVVWRNVAAWGLLLLSSTQILGHLFHEPALIGIGAASAMAPAPKVFCDVKGLESFASQFTLLVETTPGTTQAILLTPELYSQLRGPYNRRNAFGAALSAAPRLPEALWRSVLTFGICGQSPLRKELQLPADATRVAVLIETKTKGRSDRWLLETTCSE